ncbi:hypothetical protein D3C78_1592640 [compost metagenome]
MFAQGAIALGRIAIGREGEVGVGASERLGIQRAQAVALDGPAEGAAVGVSQIERDCTDLRIAPGPD